MRERQTDSETDRQRETEREGGRHRERERERVCVLPVKSQLSFFFFFFFFSSSLKKKEVNTTCVYTVCFYLKVFEWSFCCCGCVFTCYSCLIATGSQ